MKINLLYILLFFVLFSCKSGEENKNDEKENIEIQEKIETQENIEVLFDENTFEEKESITLLKELGAGICIPLEKDEENYLKPACSSKFFKLMPYKNDAPLKDAFLLLIKARVHDFPLRRVYIFQRENGKLIKVNSFVANIIGKRKSKTVYDDLILRFSDVDKNHFNCLFVWRNNHYEYSGVEQINDSNVKAEFQDSMNVEILKVIEDNGMLNI
jgi:hypothetical protein